jgi:hypothetical protein
MREHEEIETLRILRVQHASVLLFCRLTLTHFM